LPSAPPVDVPPHDPAKFGFAAKGMRGEVMAFATIGELAYARDSLDFSAVSTLAFFSLQAGADGTLLRDGRWRAWNAPIFDAVRDRAHAVGTKVVVSVSRFSWSPDETAVTVALLASSARREKLALQIAAEVVRRGVDGVNVDLEPVPVGQKAAFTSFVRRLRAALDAAAPGLQLTVAITGYYSSYDVRGLVAPGAADAIYLMGYPYTGWWSKVAGSTAPLGGAGYTVAATIAKLRADGVPAERLIVGVPYFGHLWPTASGGLNARTTGQGSDIPLAAALAILAGATPRWDPVQAVAWAAWLENGTWVQLYVDDARALAAKWARFRDLGLLGTGMWTIGFEGVPGPANDALRAAWLAGLPASDAGRDRVGADRPPGRRRL
jgi:spore germination protein YaaH